jgi:hypothetical protein
LILSIIIFIISNIFYYHCNSYISITATNSTNISSKILTRLPSSLRFLHAFHHYYNFYTSHTAIENPIFPLLLRILLMLAVEFLHVFHYHHCESHTSTTATNSTDASSRIPTRLPSPLRFLHVFHYHYNFYIFSIITVISIRFFHYAE